MKENKIFFIKKGSGAPVLFIHGIPGCGKDFETISDHLNQKEFETLIFDRPGHGRSYGTNVDYSNFFQIYSNFIKENMNKKITIVAYSFGSYIAVKLATLYPELVKKLILISPYLIHEKDDKKNDSYFKIKKSFLRYQLNIILKTKIKNGLIKHLVKAFSPDIVPADMIEKIKKFASIEMVIGGFIDKNIMIENPFAREDSMKISTPVYVIRGDKDLIAGEYNYNEIFKSPNVITIKNSGHALIFTEPNLIKNKIQFCLKG